MPLIYQLLFAWVSLSTLISVTRQNSKSPAYVPYTFPCERIDPNAAAARYTIPKQVALQTTEDSQTTTHHPLLVNDDPVKDGANDSKGFGKTFYESLPIKYTKIFSAFKI